MKKRLLLIPSLCVFLLSMTLDRAHAHDPIFGFGAHTLYKGGYGVEVEYAGEEAGDEKLSAFLYHLTYGITADFTIGFVLPHFLEKEEEGESSRGFGDMSLRGKYRFLRHDEPGATTGVALNVSVKLPSGDETKTPRLGTGSTDYLAALAINRESLRHYYFADAGYRMNSEAGGIRKGNVLFIDAAYGIRPLKAEYLKPDLVLVVELNLEMEEQTRRGGTKDHDTGGRRFFVSPGFLWSYRNVMVKGGVQLPAYQNTNGTEEEVDYRAVLSVELHL